MERLEGGSLVESTISFDGSSLRYFLCNGLSDLGVVELVDGDCSTTGHFLFEGLLRVEDKSVLSGPTLEILGISLDAIVHLAKVSFRLAFTVSICSGNACRRGNNGETAAIMEVCLSSRSWTAWICV